MTHAETLMTNALKNILSIVKDRSLLTTREVELIEGIADRALTYAWDDEKPGVDD